MILDSLSSFFISSVTVVCFLESRGFLTLGDGVHRRDNAIRTTTGLRKSTKKSSEAEALRCQAGVHWSSFSMLHLLRDGRSSVHAQE